MSTPAKTTGWAWMIGAFLLCPCHLPLTLWLLATLLYGTAAGILLHDHPYVAGAVITAVWLAATWRGLHLLQAAENCARETTECGHRRAVSPGMTPLDPLSPSRKP